MRQNADYVPVQKFSYTGIEMSDKYTHDTIYCSNTH